MRVILLIGALCALATSGRAAETYTLPIDTYHTGSYDHWGMFRLQMKSEGHFTLRGSVRQYTSRQTKASSSTFFGKRVSSMNPLPNEPKIPLAIYTSYYRNGALNQYIVPADDSSDPRWGTTGVSIVPGLFEPFRGYRQSGEKWSGDAYGNLPGRTIGGKGCAMVSALNAMHKITWGLLFDEYTPSEYNEDMKANKGYVGASVDWIAAAKVFTKRLNSKETPFSDQMVVHSNNIVIAEALLRDIGIVNSVDRRSHWVNVTMWEQPGDKKRTFDPGRSVHRLEDYPDYGTGWANTKTYYVVEDPKARKKSGTSAASAETESEDTDLDSRGTINYGNSAILVFSEDPIKFSLFNGEGLIMDSEREASAECDGGEIELGMERLEFTQAPSGTYRLLVSGPPGTHQLEIRSYNYDCDLTVREIEVVIPQGTSTVIENIEHDAGTIVLNEPVAPELLRLNSEVFLAGGVVTAVVPDGIIIQGTAPSNRVPGVLVKGEFNEDALGRIVYYMIARVEVDEDGQRYLQASEYQLTSYYMLDSMVVRPDSLPTTFKSFVETFGRYNGGRIDGVLIDTGLNAESWEYVPDGALVKSEGVFYKGVFYARYPTQMD